MLATLRPIEAEFARQNMYFPLSMCPVCLQEFDEDARIPYLTDCSHLICKYCFFDDPTCPIGISHKISGYRFYYEAFRQKKKIAKKAQENAAKPSHHKEKMNIHLKDLDEGLNMITITIDATYKDFKRVFESVMGYSLDYSVKIMTLKGKMFSDENEIMANFIQDGQTLRLLRRIIGGSAS